MAWWNRSKGDAKPEKGEYDEMDKEWVNEWYKDPVVVKKPPTLLIGEIDDAFFEDILGDE